MKTQVYGVSKKTGELTPCRAKNPDTCPYHMKGSHRPMSEHDVYEFNECLVSRTSIGQLQEQRLSKCNYVKRVADSDVRHGYTIGHGLLSKFKTLQQQVVKSREWMSGTHGNGHCVMSMDRYNELVDWHRTPTGCKMRRIHVSQPLADEFEVHVSIDKSHIPTRKRIPDDNEVEYIREYLNREIETSWSPDLADSTNGMVTFIPGSLEVKNKMVGPTTNELVFAGRIGSITGENELDDENSKVLEDLGGLGEYPNTLDTMMKA